MSVGDGGVEAGVHVSHQSQDSATKGTRVLVKHIINSRVGGEELKLYSTT